MLLAINMFVYIEPCDVWQASPEDTRDICIHFNPTHSMPGWGGGQGWLGGGQVVRRNYAYTN